MATSPVVVMIRFDLPHPIDAGRARELELKLGDTVAAVSAHHAENVHFVVANVVAAQ